MEWHYDLFLIWLIWILLIFSIVIWINKMIKIIIWNYLLISIALAMHLWLDFLYIFLENNTIDFISNQEELANWLINNKERIILIIYLLLLILIFTKSRISIWISQSWTAKLLFWIIFAPLTVISIIMWLSVVIYWPSILSTEEMINFINSFEENTFIYNFLHLIPLWIISPSLIAVIFSTEIKIHKPANNNNEQNNQEE